VLVGTLIAWCAMEHYGRGLVTTRPGSVPPQFAARLPPGVVAQPMGPTTVIHLKRIVPIAGLTMLGVFCFFVPDRDETSA
jgi:hypothetical protein